MLNPENLSDLYKDRLNAAWESLDKDIKRWQKIIPAETIIAHHLNEFEKFRKNAFNALVHRSDTSPRNTSNNLPQGPIDHSLDAEDFRAVVIGVLTAHWTLLRQVAAQRIVGSPYLAALEELDKTSLVYYHRLRNALPASLQQSVKASAPIVHLGQMSMITIFNQKVPLVLSVPFNSIDGDDNAQKSQLAIPHEIGHAILLQTPAILDQLKQWLTAEAQAPTKRQQILAHMIVGWLEEILADMIGTALAGDVFAVSAMWITATSDNNVGLADEHHPPTVVRPFIHLKVLEYLDKHQPSVKLESQISEIKSTYTEPLQDLRNRYVAQSVGDRLNWQFKSIPALTFLTLEDVKAELERAVDILLDDKTKIDALGDIGIGDLLMKCTQSSVQPSDNQLYPWGDIPQEELSQFALAIPTDLAAELHTPLTVSRGICDYLPFLPQCNR